MPNIGEVRKASELGYNIHKGHESLYTYSMCTRCSRTRWVRNQDLISGKGNLCRSCCHTTTKNFRNFEKRVIESGAKRASELGRHHGKKDPYYYPHLCSSCGKQVWHQRKDLNRVCKECQYLIRNTPKGENHHNWNGGRYIRLDGYYAVQVPKDSPYYSMRFDDNGYVLEHRLIVAQSLGRCLIDGEVVHHINGKKWDNRIENLELLPNNANHLPYIFLQQQINKLKEEIRLLKWHIRELEHANPVLTSGDNTLDKCVETIQEASPIMGNGEIVHPSKKLED